MSILPAGRFAALGLAFLVAACATETRFATPVVPPETRIATAYPSLEVAEVSLPSYAAAEDIYLRGADGGISPSGALWADLPARAITLQLARDLGAITDVIVAPEPWPFRPQPAARVDIRLEEMLATADGVFRLSGQYFVAPEEEGRATSGQFAISETIAGDANSAAAIAAARGRAVTRLAEQIAREGL